MSQFDLPRLNFSGKCTIDPATANNGWFVPLVIFQPISIQVICPPRVYLQNTYILHGKTIDDIRGLLPPGAELKLDQEGQFQGIYYVEISPIHTEDIFKDWACYPLGTYEADKDYIPLYSAVGPSSGGDKSLMGSVPGYWNYYGTMEYRYLDVKITSIDLSHSESKVNKITSESSNLPQNLKDILGASLDMYETIGDPSTNCSVMIDLLPTMAMYSQIFCNRLNLTKENKTIFSGKPIKASLRLVNAFRVVNENMPQGASGVFYSSIPLENLDLNENSDIIQFFNQYRDPRKILKGVFIKQVISEVEEVRVMDYQRKGHISNPAFAKVNGSISPWYEEDLSNWPRARQLVGGIPFKKNNKKFMAPVAVMTPAVFNINYEQRILELDFLNNFPIINTTQNSDDPAEPSPEVENSYETYPLGDIDIVWQDPEEKDVSKNMVPIATLTINNSTWPREKYFKEGGIIQIPLSDNKTLTNEKLKNGNLLFFNKTLSTSIPLMSEVPVILTSEQCGMYSNVNDEPIKGFRSNSSQREPFYLNIYKRGIPLKTPIAVTILEIKMTNSGSTKSQKILRKENYADGDMIIFPNYEAVNAIYLFTTNNLTEPLTQLYPIEILKTGFFVNLKVLPEQDYGKYLNTNHPDYKGEVTFMDLYNEIFRNYSMITPVMRFNPERWNNKHMADLLLEKINPENWVNAGYMPMSRDLNSDQIELIMHWAKTFKQAPEATSSAALAQEIHEIEEIEEKDYLGGQQFFNK